MKVEVKRNEPRNCWKMVNLLWQCLGFGSNPLFENQDQTAKPHLPQSISLIIQPVYLFLFTFIGIANAASVFLFLVCAKMVWIEGAFGVGGAAVGLLSIQKQVMNPPILMMEEEGHF